ncbi:hypothetical protein [Duganella vulcania]|uniref:DUF3325 family protein n=1 Tax=Duganella vulcania TaxID=2692166 RepID=A0A845GQ30_9BURK|nr:hypothetical protein [Duganella vulcania]MYM96384.1 hypothetical protein [Duganella vulcania]
MNWICIGVAALAALCLYLASPHQRLWGAAPKRARLLNWLAVPLGVVAIASATASYGGWCGVFIALSGFMAALVALPCLDAWLGARHAR